MGIVYYPDKILRDEAEPVSSNDIGSKKFNKLVSKMYKHMYAQKGVGLSAPQIGWSKRVIIFNPTGRPRHDSLGVLMINPEIVVTDATPCIEIEGCLSFPDLWLPVERPNRVSVRYLNKNGLEESFEVSGFISRIVQHELDHLDGILFIDRVEKSILDKHKHLLRQQARNVRDRRREKLDKKKKGDCSSGGNK